MALSDEGTLHVWGANSYGQLGLGNKANQVNTAFSSYFSLKKFLDVNMNMERRKLVVYDMFFKP